MFLFPYIESTLYILLPLSYELLSVSVKSEIPSPSESESRGFVPFRCSSMSVTPSESESLFGLFGSTSKASITPSLSESLSSIIKGISRKTSLTVSFSSMTLLLFGSPSNSRF